MTHVPFEGVFKLTEVLTSLFHICGSPHHQVIVYDHGQVIEDPSLIGRVGFTGKHVTSYITVLTINMSIR